MKLLFDENLSCRLVTLLASEFPDSSHVCDLNLQSATDDEVWRAARSGGFVIISKDDDFHQLSFLHGAPPKVIWLRIGNCPTSRIVERIRIHMEEIKAFGADGQATFLVLS